MFLLLLLLHIHTCPTTSQAKSYTSIGVKERLPCKRAPMEWKPDLAHGSLNFEPISRWETATWLGTPRGIIETWRTLEPRQILRVPAPFSVRGPVCQPAARGGHPLKHWPPAFLLHFRCSIRNRASITGPRRDSYVSDSYNTQKLYLFVF